MNFISDIKDAREGARKAQRDIELAKAFFAEHNDNPPFDVAKRFFTALGDDVDSSKPREVRAYMLTIGKFQRKWGKAHPNGLGGGSFGTGSPEVSISVISIPLGGSLADALGNVFGNGENAPDAADLMKIVREMLMNDPNYRAGIEHARELNREAGYCLGCGGGLDEDGACDGTGDEDWDGRPETAKGNPANRKPVSETLTREQKLAKVTQLRARLDQLLAEYKELKGQSPEAQAQLSEIVAEIEALEKSL